MYRTLEIVYYYYAGVCHGTLYFMYEIHGIVCTKCLKHKLDQVNG